jgi:hypothetical protein
VGRLHTSEVWGGPQTVLTLGCNILSEQLELPVKFWTDTVDRMGLSALGFDPFGSDFPPCVSPLMQSAVARSTADR